jgi:hypothetical protein
LGAHWQTCKVSFESHIQPLRDKFLELDKLAKRVDTLERRT